MKFRPLHFNTNYNGDLEAYTFNGSYSLYKTKNNYELYFSQNVDYYSWTAFGERIQYSIDFSLDTECFTGSCIYACQLRDETIVTSSDFFEVVNKCNEHYNEHILKLNGN